jgi:hypothetical protein
MWEHSFQPLSHRAAVRLVCAVLAEQHAEWSRCCRSYVVRRVWPKVLGRISQDPGWSLGRSVLELTAASIHRI